MLNGNGPVEPALFEQMFDRFLVHYEANIAVHSRPFEGAIAMLDALGAMGVENSNRDQQAGGIGRQIVSRTGDTRPVRGVSRPRFPRRGTRQARTRPDPRDDRDPEMFDTMFDRFLAHYEANIAVHSRPFEGAIAMLDALDAMGVETAIVTNKLEGLADKLFRELGLRDRFAAFLGRDSLGEERGKPAPDLIHAMIARAGGGRAVFVGDSDFDIGAARAAGIPSVAVSFGFLQCPVEELGADAVIDHFDELIPALHRLT